MKAGWRLRIAVATASLLASVLLAELTLRIVAPTRIMLPGTEIPHWREGSAFFGRFFTPDADLGFCPVLDTEAYGRDGVLRNAYPSDKPPGVVRLLFVGDSVTARGHIVRALQRRHGNDGYQYWNAGVECYNTVQEVAWYFRHNHRTAPDHVVLTLHPNDFTPSLVALYDEQGRLAMYSTTASVTQLQPWLFRNSELYRRWFLSRVSGAMARSWSTEVAAVRDALRKLRDRLAADGVRFSVLLLPTLALPTTWPAPARRAHEAAVAVTSELRIRAFDLLPALERAVADGVKIQESPGDSWHPSPEVADRFAAALAAEGLLH